MTSIDNEDTVIDVKNLTKIYKLYKRPLDRVKETFDSKKNYHDDFYALNNINFSVVKGQSLGIIGKNGSGKSTLLKIITGVLTPTNGQSTVHGNVSALLELGTGFNPEFTGLENIYFNGVIMGYTREETAQKIQSIIEFADIGEFINQPLKTYSSGMSVRLAFAVAINTDPEILIIDEALSVGDMRFQQKCYRKIQEFKKKGTILFVSHDIGAIMKFCDRVIWLNEGKVYKEGPPDSILEDFHAFMSYDADVDTVNDVSEHKELITDLTINSKVDTFAGFKSFGTGTAKIIDAFFTVEYRAGKITIFKGGEQTVLSIFIHANEVNAMPQIGFTLKDRIGNTIVASCSEFESAVHEPMKVGKLYCYTFTFAFPFLKDGSYSTDISIAEGSYLKHEQSHWIYDALKISVSTNRIHQNGRGLIVIEDMKIQQSIL